MEILCQRELHTSLLSLMNFAPRGNAEVFLCICSTRVCRGLYALHHGVTDSRNLGGETGSLDGPFSVKHLLSFPTLGDYVEFLQLHKAFQHLQHKDEDSKEMQDSLNDDSIYEHKDILYEYLMEAISLGLSCVASSLLHLGVDPNNIDRKRRLGKIKDRNRQRKMFKASPLHLACVRGEPFLVKKLLAAGCKANTPDAQVSSDKSDIPCCMMQHTTVPAVCGNTNEFLGLFPHSFSMFANRR